jgi:hypothetical protein
VLATRDGIQDKNRGDGGISRLYTSGGRKIDRVKGAKPELSW